MSCYLGCDWDWDVDWEGVKKAVKEDSRWKLWSLCVVEGDTLTDYIGIRLKCTLCGARKVERYSRIDDE